MFRVIDISRAADRDLRRSTSARSATSGADSALVGSVNRGCQRPLRRALQAGRHGRARACWSEESLLAAEGDTRLAGHRIADAIYEKLTGIKGIFSTRIAFVTKQGNRYKLNVADWDGQNVADRAQFGRADHLARLVAGRHPPRLRVVRGPQAGRLCAHPRDRPAQGGGRVPRQQQRAGLVAGRHRSWQSP